MEKFISSALKTAKSESFEVKTSTWNGSDLTALLSQNGLSAESLPSIKKEYLKAVREAQDTKNSHSIPNSDALNFLESKFTKYFRLNLII
jgi:hypothetical protein